MLPECLSYTPPRAMPLARPGRASLYGPGVAGYNAARTRRGDWRVEVIALVPRTCAAVSRMAGRLLGCALAAGLFCGASCGPAPLYNEGSRGGTSAISPRSSWTARGTVDNPAAAIDGHFTTVAQAPAGGGPARLVIDLGKPCLFNTVVLEHGMDEMAFGRQVQLAVSLEGGPSRLATITTGQRRVTVISLISPVLARQIELTAAPGSQGWSVAELYLK